MSNKFATAVRRRYRARALHQFELAAAMGVSAGALSQYLAGQVKMSDDLLARLLREIGVADETVEAAQLRLWHDVLHVPRRLHEYILRLESHRWQNDECDRRLDKLHRLTGDLMRHRAGEGPWAPLLLEEHAPEVQAYLDKQAKSDDESDRIPPSV